MCLNAVGWSPQWGIIVEVRCPTLSTMNAVTWRRADSLHRYGSLLHVTSASERMLSKGRAMGEAEQHCLCWHIFIES